MVRPSTARGPEQGLKVQCIENMKEESSATEACLQPPSHSLLTSLPKRDDLTQSTQTSSRFLQLKHMFT